MTRLQRLLPAVAMLVTALPDSGSCCPSCFGAPDAPATQGLNMAIFALLGVTGSVLAGFLSLFLGIRKRERLLQGHTGAGGKVAG